MNPRGLIQSESFLFVRCKQKGALRLQFYLSFFCSMHLLFGEVGRMVMKLVEVKGYEDDAKRKHSAPHEICLSSLQTFWWINEVLLLFCGSIL